VLVCHCAAVYDDRVREVIDAGASDVAAVASACGAGSFCGGCVPSIAALLSSATGVSAAAFRAQAARPAASPSATAIDAVGRRTMACVHELEQVVASGGWASGTVLGTPDELAERYEVTTATIRDALGVAAAHGVVTLAADGTVVAGAPSRAAVAQAVSLHLLASGVTLAELVDARTALEQATAARAATAVGRAPCAADLPRGDPSHGPQDHLDYHVALAHRTDNPVLVVLVEILIRLMRSHIAPFGSLETGARAAVTALLAEEHDAITAALRQGRADEASRLMTAHIQGFYERMPAAVRTPATGPEGVPPPPPQSPAALARSLVEVVRAEGLGPGDVVGSQAALLRRFGVPRPRYHDAVCLLEYYGIAEVQRGPGGGRLVVSTPEPWAVGQLLALHLEHLAVHPDDVLAAREAFEPRSAELAAQLADPEGVAALKRRLEVERSAHQRNFVGYHNIHPLIAELSGNRVLALLSGALTVAVMRQVARSGPFDPHQAPFDEATISAHQAIVKAIAAADGPAAREAMRDHLAHGGGA
jgi:DNA-binding FadR family transcriptional regulator/bacterioferritin-associated ferredoxin